MGSNMCSGSSENGELVVFERQVSPDKLGKYTWSCIWGYRGACMEALRRAEEKKGSPPFVMEIAQEWSSMIPMLAPLFLLMGLQDLFKNDEVLTNINNERWTLRREL
jgi:hypothetical protein